MKKLIFLVALAAFATTACNNSKTESSNAILTDSTKATTANTEQIFTLDTTTLATGAIFYQCEMHPAVNSDKAGSCPKCGMDLTEMKKQ